MDADAVLPVPPSFEVTALVVLFCVPAAVPVTFTENVQEALPARLAPDRLMVFVFCVAVMVPPPQEPVRPLGVDTIRPAGRVSVKPIPVSVFAVLGLLMLKLSEVEPPRGIDAAPKALLIAGGATTVMEAVDVLPGPVVVEVTVTLLFFTPAEVP
jgi:hypothetical protein